jgi:endonuclease-3
MYVPYNQTMQSKSGTNQIFSILDATYGSVKTFLAHETPFQLLIAVILSAQTTDVLVNKVTPNLFAKYPDAAALKLVEVAEIANDIRQVNYYRTKAKHLKETARIIDDVHGGIVPQTIEELTKLHGVGRKVANVIIADIFGIPEGVVVDTHVKRVSFRIGWTKKTDPVKIEQDLMNVWPKERWINTPKQIILIGRQFCFARNPNCPDCPLREVCEKNGVITRQS